MQLQQPVETTSGHSVGAYSSCDQLTLGWWKVTQLKITLPIVLEAGGPPESPECSFLLVYEIEISHSSWFFSAFIIVDDFQEVLVTEGHGFFCHYKDPEKNHQNTGMS